MTKLMERPIPSFIIIFLVFFIISSILSYVFGELLSGIIPELAKSVGLIISTLIIAFLYAYLFKIKNFFSFSNFKSAIILISPLIIFIIGNLLDSNLAISSGYALIIAIISGIAPGIFEEIIFRGVVISYLMKFFKNSKSIIWILIVSALIFGIVHLFNVFAGAPLDTTLFQFFYTFAVGIILGAVYLRTGNLWAPIIIHSIVDIIAFISSTTSSIGVLQAGLVLDITNIIFLIGSIIAIILGIYYIRSDKHNEILVLWEEKWAN